MNQKQHGRLSERRELQQCWDVAVGRDGVSPAVPTAGQGWAGMVRNGQGSAGVGRIPGQGSAGMGRGQQGPWAGVSRDGQG